MKSRTGFGISLLVTLTLIGGILFVPTVKVLCIEEAKNPSKKICSKSGASGFCISYTHSVNKGRVHDYYIHDGNELILYKTEFVSYGAGMPELEENPDATFYADEERNTYAMEYSRKVGKSFLMAVGVIADHSISFNPDYENEFFLKDFFDPQTRLKINIKRIPLINLISGKNLQEETWKKKQM